MLGFDNADLKEAEVFDKAEGIKQYESEELFLSTLSKFPEQNFCADGVVEQLVQSYIEKNYFILNRCAHSLKGGAKYSMIQRLEEKALRLQVASKEVEGQPLDLKEIDESYYDLMRYMFKLHKFFCSYFQKDYPYFAKQRLKFTSAFTEVEESDFRFALNQKGLETNQPKLFPSGAYSEHPIFENKLYCSIF